jgi:hypothetical protein
MNLPATHYFKNFRQHDEVKAATNDLSKNFDINDETDIIELEKFELDNMEVELRRKIESHEKLQTSPLEKSQGVAKTSIDKKNNVVSRDDKKNS